MGMFTHFHNGNNSHNNTPQTAAASSSTSATVNTNFDTSSLISSDNQLNFDNQPTITLVNGSGTQIDPITEVNVLTQVVTNTSVSAPVNVSTPALQQQTTQAVATGHAKVGGSGHVAHADAGLHLGSGASLQQEVLNLVQHDLAHQIGPDTFLIGG